jgi:DNA polymerase-3 subunit gamma/tau
MSALYQRARPTRFDEVVGQEHVKEVLVSAVRRGRTGHAYLFSGPRGVGKTTTARLLAMAVNCEREDPGERPCGTCASCRLVQQGSHPDVTELDAASNNSVDDVRDLREKVGLASLRGGTRVWILDEAHMLSRAAANALLKTLEEPPPGLMFVLATTEPEKLPPTILSRCQHFRFRRLSEREIAGKLSALCQSAEVSAEPEALALVARAADGGMRDAESMLERLLITDGAITAAAAEDALGLPPRERLERMAEDLAAGRLGPLLDEAGGLYRDGFAPRTLAEQLGRTLRDGLVLAVGSSGAGPAGLEAAALMRLLHVLDDEMERFQRHDDLYALEVALIKAMDAVHGAPDAAADAAATPDAAEGGARPAPAAQPRRRVTVTETPAGRAGAADTESPGVRAADPAPNGNAPETTTATATGAATGAEPEPEPAAFDPNATAGARPAARRAGPQKASPLSWHAVKSRAGPQLKAFLMPAEESVQGHEVRLRFHEKHRFHHKQLLEHRDELEALIDEVAGPGYTLAIEGPDGRSSKKA